MEKLLKLIEAIKIIIPNVMLRVGEKIAVKHEFTLGQLLELCETYKDIRDGEEKQLINPRIIDPFPNPYNPKDATTIMMYGCPVDYSPTYTGDKYNSTTINAKDITTHTDDNNR
jgi:hypothetical protein